MPKSDFENVMTDNTDNLNGLIEKLDSYLYAGYLLKTMSVDECNKRQKENDSTFNINEFQLDFEHKINVWLNETAKIITSSLKEKHYYFHFVHPQGSALSYSHPLGHLISSLDRHLFALEEVILSLEEKRNLSVRQEIAEKEFQADKMYEITYSTHTREIKLNNILLANPDFSTENELFFQFMYENSGRPVSRKEIESHCGNLKKRVSDILRDLNFAGAIRQNFFPVATEKEVMFVNPISKQFFYEKVLPAINFSQLGRQRDTQGD